MGEGVLIVATLLLTIAYSSGGRGGCTEVLGNALLTASRSQTR